MPLIGAQLVGIRPHKCVGRIEQLRIHEPVQRGHDLERTRRGADPRCDFGICVRLQSDALRVVEHFDVVRRQCLLFAAADELAHEDGVRTLRRLDPRAGLGRLGPGQHQREISIAVAAERALVAVIEGPASAFAASIEGQAEMADRAGVAPDPIAVLPVELHRVVLRVGVVATHLAPGRVRPGPERRSGVAVADHLGGWTCSNCAAGVERSFDVCWRCGTLFRARKTRVRHRRRVPAGRGPDRLFQLDLGKATEDDLDGTPARTRPLLRDQRPGRGQVRRRPVGLDGIPATLQNTNAW